jgi:hypothetical protein
MFVRLRAAIDFDTPLPFEVEPEAFEEWSQDLTDLGGYEHDPTRKELKILTLPGVLGIINYNVLNKQSYLKLNILPADKSYIISESQKPHTTF